MISPYVGVTGFMSKEEVESVLTVVPEWTERKLMVGVLVSAKTMQGVPNNYPNRYPAIEEVAKIFTGDLNTLNLIHFHTNNFNLLFSQMMKLTELGGENFHGFQLNVCWPDPEIIWRYKLEHPQKVIVLQCGETAMEVVGNDPKRLYESLQKYVGLCDCTLIDPSGGRGKPLNPYKMLGFLTELTMNVWNMEIAVAGGLSADTIEDLLEPVIKRYPYVSCDAEGGLRDEKDNLSVVKAKDFVTKAYNLFDIYER